MLDFAIESGTTVGKLEETRDFVDLFTYVCGEWTTPSVYYRWMALQLIAAVIEDRVSIEFDFHAATYPNIWVCLIGPSGTGKDHCIRMALHLLKPEDPIWRFDGRSTVPGLYDYMAARQKADQRASAPVFLVSSDITELLSPGPEAIQFTTRILALYDRHERVFMDMTRTGGPREIHRPMLNWVFGSTPEWFPKAIDPGVFSSGFSPRTFFVMGKPIDANFHLKRPIQRHDQEEVLAHLRTRVEELLAIPEGSMFVWHPDAERMYDQFLLDQQYKLQHTKVSEADRIAMNRLKVWVVKLAMLLSLARWRPGKNLTIWPRALRLAMDYSQDALRDVKIVTDLAYIGPDTKLRDFALTEIRQAGEHGIPHMDLYKFLSARGLPSPKHFKDLMDILKESGYIREDVRKTRGRPAKVYVAITRKIQLAEPEQETTDGTENPQSQD